MFLFGPPNVEKMIIKKDVKGLIRALRYQKDASIRKSAAEALGQVGDAHAVEPLIELFSDTVGPVRQAAASALGQIRDARSVVRLIAMLKDGEGQVRRATAISLGQLGDARAVEPLIDVFRDNDQTVRQAAIEALTKIGTAAIVKLLPQLKDSNRWMRESAAQALDRLGWLPEEDENGANYWIAKSNWKRCVDIGAMAVDPLIRVFQNNDRVLRQSAAATLGQIGDARAVNPLIALLKDGDNTVRQSAIEALGQIQDSAAVKPLISMFKDSEAAVRQSTTGALVKIGLPAVEPLISVLTESDPAMRQLGADTLHQMGWNPKNDEIGATYWIAKRNWEQCVEIGAPALNPLIRALNDKEPLVRQAAAGALSQIGDPSAVQVLIALFKDQEAGVREAAIKALAKMGAPAEDSLIPFLHDSDSPLHPYAIRTLDEMGWQPKNDETGATYWIAKRNWERCAAIGAPAVNPLIGELKNSDHAVRQSALQALIQIGSPSIGPLAATLKDSNTTLRQAAIEALEKIGWVPQNDETGAIYWIAKGNWQKCVDIGAPAVKPLIDYLASTSSSSFRPAAEALGQIADSRAVQPLGEVLKKLGFSPYNKSERKTLVTVLGKIGSPAAIPILNDSIKRDPSYGVERRAKRSIEWIQAKNK